MEKKRTVGLVFVEGWADWEFGMLSGSVNEWFGGRVVSLSPSAGPLKSIGGLRLIPDRDAASSENTDLDAVAVIGSDTWSEADAPDISPLLKDVLARGGIVGGICAGTLALARAGLFSGRKHTSNGAGWIESRLESYAGSEFYQDVPHAVRDGHVVSAAGTAPGTFAIAFLEALFPEQAPQIAEMRDMIGREFQAG
ncbi:DJ-1/PfpI family protein [Phyllobacterium sp. YR531]|uniref:DJ-1/PfpI family protein n=1 Tax=Phyllobacterium sp. YR531 TaxID=1144343 RepID=UPI00026FCCA7|nr:DJ-1/PfpI family protein [Phyllobacterium sp. YR531]EJM99481.1 transcriptional regulator containing an amidase domain and an AraC-type DNA-binding HTH domain [Phyllobacterium sp. YR531]